MGDRVVGALLRWTGEHPPDVRAPARRHRQGRHREDDGRRRARPRAGRRRPLGRCWSRSRAGRASPSCSTPRRCPTRSAGSPSPAAAARSRRWPSTPRRRCWSTSTCSTSSRRAGRALRKMGAIDFATTIAPGLRDVLLTGKVKEAVTRAPRRAGRSTTPSSWTPRRPAGSPASSTSPPRWRGLARSGPIKTQSDGVMAVLRSPQTAVHLVTLLEEMPVQETADAIAELRRPACRSGSVIVNMATDPRAPCRRPSPRAADGRADRRRARAARWPPRTCPATRAVADGRWPREAVEHAERWTAQDALRDDVEALGLPTLRAAAARPGRGPRRAVRARRPPGRARRRWPRERRPGRGEASGRPGRTRRRALDVDALLADPATRIVVCCGAGGVGQDDDRAPRWRCAPPSAGARVVVLTIDPARRLAQSMGLTELDNEPAAGAGRRRRPSGELHAMMLDMKRTFDEIVAAHSDARAGRADPGQPLLPVAVSSFSGTQEYMAMEKLGQLRGQRPVGPDHRRHPAVAVRAGLPRRPEPDGPLPRRPDDPAAHAPARAGGRAC